MAVAYFEPGRLVEIDGAVYELNRLVGDDEWQLEDKSTGRYITHTVKELHVLYMKQRLRFLLPGNGGSKVLGREAQRDRQIAALDVLLFEGDDDTSSRKKSKKEKKQLKKNKKRVEDAKVRQAYVTAVKSAGLSSLTQESLEPVIQATWQELRKPMVMPNWVTVYRWIRRYRDGGSDIRALLSQDMLKGNRTRRYETAMLEIVAQAVDTIYMTRERNTVEDTCDHAIYLVSQENKLRPKDAQLPLPTTSLVKKTIQEIPAFDRCVARKGREAALAEHRAVLHRVVTSRPLERVEIDHTQLDIMLVDDETYLPLGRPTLTVCVDVFTRCVLGIYIGFEPPSFYTVSQCLKHAFLPKTDLHERFPGIRNEWEPHGVADILVVDNGMEFHSESLESLAFCFGMTILYTPRKRPWYKGAVERAIGTMNRGTARGKPGTTFANVLEREDYDAAKNATITQSTFQEIVYTWVVDIYHQESHKTLDKRPITQWRKHAPNMLVPLPADTNDFDALIGAVKDRVVSHKGVESAGLFYNSRELADLRMRLGSNFTATIRYNPCNLGHIYVFEPDTNRPIRVPALRADYAEGVSEWQHKVFKKYAREHLGRKDIEAVAEAKERIRQLVMQDMSDKRIKTRSKAARLKNDGGKSAIHQRPEANSAETSATVPIPNQIDNGFGGTETSAGSVESMLNLEPNERDRLVSVPRKLKILKN